MTTPNLPLRCSLSTLSFLKRSHAYLTITRPWHIILFFWHSLLKIFTHKAKWTSLLFCKMFFFGFYLCQSITKNTTDHSACYLACPILWDTSPSMSPLLCNIDTKCLKTSVFIIAYPQRLTSKEELRNATCTVLAFVSVVKILNLSKVGDFFRVRMKTHESSVVIRPHPGVDK